MAPKPQCKISGPKRLKSKRRTQPLKENFPAPPLPSLPDPDWSGCVPVSVCLFKPSLWEVFLVFLLTIFFLSLFFTVYFGEPGRSSRFPQSGSHGYRRGDSVKDGG